MYSQPELKHLKNIGIEQCDPEQLVDLTSISLDHTRPLPDRMYSFLEQVKNPYLFKVDDIIVKVEFSSGKSLEQSLLSLLSAEPKQ